MKKELEILDTDTKQEKLFKEAYNKSEAEDIIDVDITGFIKCCERLYKMRTEDFRILFKKNNYEGNVDMQLWYRLTDE